MKDRIAKLVGRSHLAAVLSLAVAVVACGPAAAQSLPFAWDATGNIQLQPNNSYRIDPYDPNNIGEYTGQLADLSPGNLGYHRYRVAFQRADFIPSDRDVPFEVRLTWPGRGSAFPPPSVVVRVVIPQGAIEGAADVYVPQYEQQYSIQFETTVDGRRDPKLSGMNYHGYNQSQGRVSVLIGDRDTYDSLLAMTSVVIQSDFDAISDPAKSPLWTTEITTSGSQQASNAYGNASENPLHLSAVASCPSDRLAWSTIDQVIAEQRVLDQLESAQAAALIDHVCAGARLVIFGEGELDESREAAERWFAERGVHPIASGWTTIKASGDGLTANFFGGGGVQGETNVFGLGELLVLPTGDVAEAVTGDSVGHAELINGAAAAIQGIPAQYLFNGSRITQLQTVSFWDWSLERLGRPPVLTFCVLVGLFVGVLAPGVLIYSLRTGRPVLMLLLYPAIAAIGVAALAVFAITKDGFRTHTRTRSVVMADAGGEDSFAISRQVLFSGVAPRGGLRFDAGSEVIPIDPRSGSYGVYSSSDRGGPPGVLQWTGEEQVYRGMLRSREQQQFVVVGPSPQRCPIDGVELGAAGEPGRARNASESAIELLLVCDGRGNMYAAQDVAAGQTATLRSVSPEESQQLIGAFEQTQPLTPPADLALAGGDRGVTSFLFSGGNIANQGGGMTSFDRYTAIVDSFINESRLKGTACYLAYMAQTPAIDLAVEGAVDEGSLHLITGRWETGK